MTRPGLPGRVGAGTQGSRLYFSSVPLLSARPRRSVAFHTHPWCCLADFASSHRGLKAPLPLCTSDCHPSRFAPRNPGSGLSSSERVLLHLHILFLRPMTSPDVSLPLGGSVSSLLMSLPAAHGHHCGYLWAPCFRTFCLAHLDHSQPWRLSQWVRSCPHCTDLLTTAVPLPCPALPRPALYPRRWRMLPSRTGRPCPLWCNNPQTLFRHHQF